MVRLIAYKVINSANTIVDFHTTNFIVRTSSCFDVDIAIFLDLLFWSALVVLRINSAPYLVRSVCQWGPIRLIVEEPSLLAMIWIESSIAGGVIFAVTSKTILGVAVLIPTFTYLITNTP